MLRRTGFAICLALASGALMAHEELPHPVWCAGGTMNQVASFQFGADALVARSGSGSGGSCTGSVGNLAKNCGQFDDDYKRGYDASQGYCGTFSRPRRLNEVPDAGSVIVLVTSPDSFLRSTHHADYSVSQGLEGVCLRCEGLMSPVLPVRPRANSSN